MLIHRKITLTINIHITTTEKELTMHHIINQIEIRFNTDYNYKITDVMCSYSHNEPICDTKWEGNLGVK